MSIWQSLSGNERVKGVAVVVGVFALLGIVGSRYIDSTKEKSGQVARFATVTQQTARDGRTNFPGQTASSTKAKFRPALGSINLNTATEAELDQLPGVGPATARKIVEYRIQHGGFQSLDQLDDVKGIGPKKLAEMRPYCRL